MRIDPDHCTDPVLLAAEVRRLRNAMSHDHWDAICQEGERVSREEGYKAMQAEVVALHAECERLRGKLAWTERERDSLRVAIQNLAERGVTLTDAERQLIGRLSDRFEAMGNFDRRPSSPGVSQECEQDAATLRGLLERLA